MKLEVGMYARIDGKIGKVIDICTCEQCEARGYYEPIIEYAHRERDYVSVYWKNNLKVSHNIGEILKAGDFLDYLCIAKIEGTTIFLKDGWYIDFDDVEDMVETICTKEQFESISYEVSK